MLDSFYEGGFDLGTGGLNGNSDMIQSDFLTKRSAYGVVAGFWHAELLPASGVMSFSVQLRGTPITNDFFNLDYRPASSTFSLLGFDAIHISVNNLTGVGELAAFVNASVDLAVRIPITGTGDLVYPVSLLDHGFPLEDLYALQFRIYPRTADFSITLDQITLVPEPGLSALILLAGGFGFFRRHRL